MKPITLPSRVPRGGPVRASDAIPWVLMGAVAHLRQAMCSMPSTTHALRTYYNEHGGQRPAFDPAAKLFTRRVRR